MFAVDTNVFLYAANKDVPEHSRCNELVSEWRAQATPWFSTWNIIYEFLRVATHPRVMQRPLTVQDAWSFIESIREAPSFRMLEHTERHPLVLAEVLKEVPRVSGNLLFDAHTASLLREHGVRRIVTRDTDFHRFKFLDVVDPLEAERE